MSMLPQVRSQSLQMRVASFTERGADDGPPVCKHPEAKGTHFGHFSCLVVANAPIQRHTRLSPPPPPSLSTRTSSVISGLSSRSPTTPSSSSSAAYPPFGTVRHFLQHKTVHVAAQAHGNGVASSAAETVDTLGTHPLLLGCFGRWAAHLLASAAPGRAKGATQLNPGNHVLLACTRGNAPSAGVATSTSA